MAGKWSPEAKAKHKLRMQQVFKAQKEKNAGLPAVHLSPIQKPAVSKFDSELEGFMAERPDGNFKPLAAAANAVVKEKPGKTLTIVMNKPETKELEKQAESIFNGFKEEPVITKDVIETAEALRKSLGEPEHVESEVEKTIRNRKRSYEEGLEKGYDAGLKVGYERGTRALNTALAALPQYQPEWEGRDVQILMPLHLQTNGATLYMLMAFALDIGMKGLRFDMEMGDAMIYHARNKLANRFMGTGANWSFWIDSDIVAPFGRAALMRQVCSVPQTIGDDILGRYAIHRLLSHKQMIVGGTYFGRQKSGPPMFGEALHDMQANREARDMRDGTRETAWVATGCLMVNRQVYLDIQAKFPELAPQGQREEWDYFRPGEVDGEDVAFCKRAKAAGHTVFVDTGLQCMHVGYCAWGAHNTQNVKKPGAGLFD